MQAISLLGWRDVPVRRLGQLTDAELREVELEENLRRKDLTAEERSRNLIALAKTAAETLGSDPQVSKPARGPAPNPSSARQVAQKIGVDEKTIRNARDHVAAQR